MSDQEQPIPQEENQVVDPFAIFGMDAETIASYEEPQTTDWSKIFFEPDPKEKATITLIKFLPNIYDPRNPILHKFSYKLPHPESPNRTFNFASPTSIGKKCPVVDAWYDMKNSDDPRLNKVAEKLKRKRTRCGVIQIMQDTAHPELAGELRLFRFQYDGDIDNLVKRKIKPSEEDIKTLDAKPDNIFDPFGSPILILRCKTGEYGRDFSGSEWAPESKNMGMLLKDADGKMQRVTKENAGSKEIQQKIVEALKAENVNINEYYAYKEPSEETMKLVKSSIEKLTSGQITIQSGSNSSETESTPEDDAAPAAAISAPANAPNSDVAKAVKTDVAPQKVTETVQSTTAVGSETNLLAELGIVPEQ